MAPTTEHAWVLPREKHAPTVARRRLEESCSGDHLDHLDDARLLVTELVSNAVLHGTGPVGLVLSRASKRLRVSVEDESPSLPVVGRLPTNGVSGRGMHLVARLATGWGVSPRADGRPGKRVWFEVT